MKRVAFLVVVLLPLTLVPLFAQNATVEQTTGKVQLLAPGGTWANAAVGSLVTAGTVVSTGFNSTAVLNLGTSTLQVKPLTRLKLNELIRTNTTATTSLYLTVGAVHANVANNLGITQKFSVQSPVSTAAVRGTIFDFDGFTLTVDRGIVHFSSAEGLGRQVIVGQSSNLDGPYVPGSAEEFQQAASQVSSQTGASGTTGTPKSVGPLTGSVTITVQ